MTVAEIIKRCKAALEAYYGPRFRGLVVYGSVARGEATPASDIDMLVLLSQPFDYYHELRQIVDLLYPIQLESDQLVSAKPAAWTEFERGSIQLYRKAKSEGVLDYGVTAHVSPGQAQQALVLDQARLHGPQGVWAQPHLIWRHCSSSLRLGRLRGSLHNAEAS